MNNKLNKDVIELPFWLNANKLALNAAKIVVMR